MCFGARFAAEALHRFARVFGFRCINANESYCFCRIIHCHFKRIAIDDTNDGVVVGSTRGYRTNHCRLLQVRHLMLNVCKRKNKECCRETDHYFLLMTHG